MDLSQIINLVKSASGLLLNQKNVAFFEETTYKKGNSVLDALGIDTNTILGGVFNGDVTEVLKGGKIEETLGIDIGALDGVASFLLGTEPLEAAVGVQSTIMEHPLEMDLTAGEEYRHGITAAQGFLVEHQIILPTHIEVALVLPTFLYSSVLEELSNLIYTKRMLTIVTKAGVYPRQVLLSYDIPLRIETISRMVVMLKFREIQITANNSPEVKNPNNASAK